MPVAILALNLNSESEERAAFERAGLGAYIVKAVEGSYKGETERSYIVDVGRSGVYFGELAGERFRAVLDFAKAHGQESVLFLDYKRDAALFYCEDYRSEVLGRWKAAPKAVATTRDGWTRDGETYYIIEGA